MKKAKEKMLWEGFTDTIVPAKVTQILSFVNFTWKYRWAINNIDIDATKKLRQTGIKKY